MIVGSALCVFAIMLLGWTKEVAGIFSSNVCSNIGDGILENSTDWPNAFQTGLTLWLAVLSVFLIDFSVNAGVHFHLLLLTCCRIMNVEGTHLTPLMPPQLHESFPSDDIAIVYLVQAALSSLTQWSPTAPPNIILNATTNVKLVEEGFDYPGTRGAVIGFCRALSKHISEQAEFRVNSELFYSSKY